MNNPIKAIITISLLLIVALSGNAKENIGSPKKKKRVQSSALKKQASNCSAASAQTDLDVNNVRTTLLNGGDMWWDLNDAKYEVPKVSPPGSKPSVNSLFAGSIWVGGIDPGGNLKVAAQTYRQSGNDYWPGPLDKNASVNSQTCTNYDRFWDVSGSDISDLIAASDQGTSTVPAKDISTDILQWPAKGNPNAQGTQGVTLNITSDLAPFEDVDGDGQYDPTKGDFPIINEDNSGVFADQMIFWVFNDKGNIHTETGGQAIGLEVKATAFAFSTSDEVNNMTFYRYTISNESSSTLNQTYMGQWVDPDLGCFTDDFVGSDTVNNLGIVYNGDAFDEDCATSGYGSDIPLLGVDFFEGPTTADGKELGLESFVFYNNDFSTTGNPENAVDYFNYLSGFWKDGSPITFGGNGFGGSQPFPFMFPSDPDDQNGWSECTAGNTPDDRRFLQSSGPFTLQPGAVNNITTGVMWVRQNSQSGCAADFDLLRRADQKAQSLFESGFDLIDRPDAPTLKIREMDEELVIELFNEEGSNNFNESYESVDPDAAIASRFDSSVTDTTYNFQGYKLFELANAQVSAEDLDDPTKARLVAQVDIRDDVDRIINWERDASLQSFIPTLEVDGNNQGVRHTFRVNETKFAEGNPTLVNHRTYYFAAVAYAHNNFKDFVFSTDDFTNTEGQDQPFLQSRRNFQVYSGIPHQPEPGREGTVVNSEFGDGLQITRIEGQGNGGLELDLTDQSVQDILNSSTNAVDEITYKKNKGPVDVKVVDPLTVVNAQFSLFLNEDSSFVNDSSATELTNNATWYLVDRTRGDTIFSNLDIRRANEQTIKLRNESGDIVRDYGISITMEQVPDPGKLEDEAPFDPVAPKNGFLSAEIEFENTQDRWLQGVQDEDGEDWFNWIRSGVQEECNRTGVCANDQNNNDTKGFYEDYYRVFEYSRMIGPNNFTRVSDSVRFRDPDQGFEDALDGTWAPYALSANFSQDDCLNEQGGGDPTRCVGGDPPHFTNGPAFPRTRYGRGFANGKLQLSSSEQRWNNYIPQNTLAELNSVDIVLTSDKSKWSRTPVLELGEQDEFTQGATQKGQLRMHPSIDSTGGLASPIATSTLDTSQRYVFIGEAGGRLKVFEQGSAGSIVDSTSFESGEVIDLTFETAGFEKIGEGQIYNLSDIGMGYFPGYAINLETGERLNIMFGEASNLGDNNGDDMIWNPTSNLQGPLANQRGSVLFGGKHNIYVHKSRYDAGQSVRDTLRKYHSQGNQVPEPIREVHDSIMWVSIPILNPDSELKSYENGLIPNKATVKLRVNKPYEKLAFNGSNNGLPHYQFSTGGLGVDTGQTQVAKDALDKIKVVPNPYFGFSSFESSQIDNEVKITNLPPTSTITIYSINGDLIRQFDRNVRPNTSPGQPTTKQNLDSTVDWDLNNFKNVPIASGIYLIHVQADGLGERTIKWFGVKRPIDLDSF